MKLELEIAYALCYCPTFKINDIDAEQGDFGEQYDRDPEEAEPYGCGNMKFTRIEPSASVLKKYKINKDEYSEICYKLEDGLSFGCCGWCV